jgi:hypothetical protein
LRSCTFIDAARKLNFRRRDHGDSSDGGAGYIGSVTVERLTAKGESIVVLDDLAYGHLESIDSDIPFIKDLLAI